VLCLRDRLCCKHTRYTKKQVAKFENFIQKQYRVHWLMDNLPQVTPFVCWPRFLKYCGACSSTAMALVSVFSLQHPRRWRSCPCFPCNILQEIGFNSCSCELGLLGNCGHLQLKAWSKITRRFAWSHADILLAMIALHHQLHISDWSRLSPICAECGLENNNRSATKLTLTDGTQRCVLGNFALARGTPWPLRPQRLVWLGRLRKPTAYSCDRASACHRWPVAVEKSILPRGVF
jgi:hypothetical protein